MAQPEMVSIVNVAKASVNAYNEKNWDKVRASLTPDCVYEEVATRRKVQGINDTLALWQGWAKAIPDSTATFESQFVSENMVALELTWRGTHRGPLMTPGGEIQATGKSIALKACQLIEVSGERAKSIRQYFDLGTLLEQIGASPETGSRATIAADPVRVDSRHYSVESETDQVRVLRVSYGPREKSVMHEHPPVVAVFLTEARFRFTFADGRSEERTGKPGDAMIMPAEQHLPENIGDNRAEVVVIELKNRL